MKRRLVLLLLPVLLVLGFMQMAPAHASSPPSPRVSVSTPYVACLGNFWIGRGVCIPWTL